MEEPLSFRETSTIPSFIVHHSSLIVSLRREFSQVIRFLARFDRTSFFLLCRIGRRLERQAHHKGAAAIRAGAGRLDLAAVLRDDAMADRQAQAGALAGAAAREERLEDVV